MKKKRTGIILIIVILAVLFVPVPTGVYKDGGTKIYSALTYKIVDWNVLVGVEDTYSKTSIYWFPNNLKSYDELWKLEN